MTEPAQPRPAEPFEEPPPPRSRSVGIAITATIVLFLSAVALTAYRSFVTIEPSTVLVIDASDRLAGAEVSVQSVDEPTTSKAVFGVGERFSIPFYLEPGAYIVKITRDGETICGPEEITVRKPGARMDFTKFEPKVAATRPVQP